MLLFTPFGSLLILLAKFLFGYYIILFLIYYFNYKEIYEKSVFLKGLLHLKVATLCLVTIFTIDFIFRGSMIDDFFTDSLNITLSMFVAWVSSLLAPILANYKK